MSCMDRRQFLRFLGIGAAAAAANPVGTIARAMSSTSSLRVESINGSMVLTVPPVSGASYESVARNITGHTEFGSRLLILNEPKHPGENAIEVPWTLVMPELKEALNEQITLLDVAGEDEDTWTLAEFIEDAIDVVRWGFEKTMLVIAALNGFTEENPSMRAGTPVRVPASVVVKSCNSVDREKGKISEYPARFRRKPAPGKRTPRSDRELIESMAKFYPPIPVTYQQVVDNLRACDKKGAPRKRSGRRGTVPHTGLDVFAPIGTRILPIEVGRILEIKHYKKPNKYYRNGRSVKYMTASGMIVQCLHLSAFRSGLKKGDLVDIDTVIGYAGISGNGIKTNPHVHLQIRTKDIGDEDDDVDVVDPLPYVLGAKNAELERDVRNPKTKYLEFYRKVDMKAL